jgi:hypothetical protein
MLQQGAEALMMRAATEIEGLGLEIELLKEWQIVGG